MKTLGESHSRFGRERRGEWEEDEAKEALQKKVLVLPKKKKVLKSSIVADSPESYRYSFQEAERSNSDDTMNE